MPQNHFTPDPNQFPKIEVLENDPLLMKMIVEELASKQKNGSHAGVPIDENLMAVDTSSTETYITGSMNFELQLVKYSIPFIAGFVFTCLKSVRPSFEMEWSISLT